MDIFYYIFIPVVLQVHMFYFLNCISNGVFTSFDDVSLAMCLLFFSFLILFLTFEFLSFVYCGKLCTYVFVNAIVAKILNKISGYSLIMCVSFRV